jgi:hypothetical protein
MGPLLWARPRGQLAEALGVTEHRARVVEKALAPILARPDGNLRECFDTLETLDLTFNEWTSAVFALGFWHGRTNKEALA